MLRFSEIKVSNDDYTVLVITFVLLLIGLVAIYSASSQVETPELMANFPHQVVWALIGIIFMIITILIPTSFYYIASYWLYGFSILLLIITLFSGSDSAVSRWIDIGPFRFQPSEFAKIAVILALARFLSHEKRDLEKLKDIAIAFGIAFLPFMLVAKQPNLGTAIVFLGLLLPVIYWAGLPTFYLFIVIIPFVVMVASFNYYTFFLAMVIIIVLLLLFRRRLAVSLIIMLFNIAVGIVTPLLWNQLHVYQKHRILTFLGLEIDPKGSGYQVIQSKVAIGSGGLFGKGLFNGTQTQLRFLPAQHTDFVFSVIGEEAGFVGSVFVLLLFLLLILRGIQIASKVRNQFGGLVVLGAVTILGFHIIVNIGMTVGMMPVTGLPLPFLSYGGSFLIVCMILIGLIINVSIRRFRY